MHSEWTALTHNTSIWAGLLAWFIAQAVKMSAHWWKTREIDFRFFVSTGGMPSAHSAAVCALAIMPFLWMLGTSLKTPESAMAYPPQFIPDPVRPQNYSNVLTNPKADFLLWTRNTLIVAVLAVSGTVISSALVAYGFARIRFKGRGVMFAVIG